MPPETKRGSGAVKEYRGGKPFLALVEIVVVTPGDRSIELVCKGEGFTGQGDGEVVPEQGYDHWKGGARAGARFALEAAVADASVTIESIVGMHTDTNPSIVALATARAIWNALETQPPAHALAQIESEAFSSWSRDFDALPHLAEP